MRTGVYHARADGRVCFDESPLTLHEHPDLRRYLAAEPNATAGEHLQWEVRKTGSAALECAFVAAGLLRIARFETPHLWNVAAGLALPMAAKRDVREQFEGHWRALAPTGSAELGSWRRPLIIGEPAAVTALILARSAIGPG